jgi:tetratricopeptide (TPR) repeat protein
VDAIVGDFLAQLERLGVYDRAAILIVSDHGEGLNDHGEAEHGIFLYREAIHVPLLLKLPASERKGETVDTPVGLVDLAPTIAELGGITLPREDGRSLLAPPDRNRRIYGETLYPRIHLGWSELRSLIGSQFHFIQAPRPELYDIGRDAGERSNIISEERRTYAAMREELEKYGTAVELPSHIDPEEAKKLAALGYLSSAPQAPSGPLPDPKDRIGEIAAMIAANQHLQAGRLAEAIDAFRGIVTNNPQLSDGWVQLGSALEQAGREDEALDVYRNAIDVAPELAPELALKRGATLLKLERYDEAKQHARLAERTNPGGMHLLLARIALARKEYRAAEEESTAATKDAGSALAAEVLLAQAYTQQGRLQEALAVVERAEKKAAAEQSGPVESLHFVRGDILGRMERYDEAIAVFRKEIALFPRNRQPYANLYLVYRVTNRPREAEGALEEMVRAIPTKQTMLFAAKTASVLGDDAVAASWRRRAR